MATQTRLPVIDMDDCRHDWEAGVDCAQAAGFTGSVSGDIVWAPRNPSPPWPHNYVWGVVHRWLEKA